MLTHIGETMGYQLYQSQDGIIEAYKSGGEMPKDNKPLFESSNRIVSNVKTITEFIEFIRKYEQFINEAKGAYNRNK
jgi:hypothetical protein